MTSPGPDHAWEPPATPTVTETRGLSPKTILATVTTTVVGVLIAILNEVTTNAALLGGLPPTLQFIVLAAIPPILVGLSAYTAKPGQTVERNSLPRW